MPRLTAATPAARSEKFGNRANGTSSVGAETNGWIVRSSGTATPSTEKSSDPVPRRPDVYQVSWNVTSAASNQHSRNVSSSQRAPPRIHWQCWVPLPHCQRPVTVTVSPATTPTPFGANTPPATVDASRKISWPWPAAGTALATAVVEAIIEHHPAAPSARASVSIAVSIVSGSASGPP